MEILTPPVQKWLNVIHAYDNEFKKWEGRTKKIIRRYRDDERQATVGDQTAKFNILWSNVQTLIPAVYAKMPKASVSRRFSDNDPVGRVASLLIERALDYEIEHYPDFRATMKNSVEDRFLGGRGVAWVRYDPHIKTQDMPEDGFQVTEDIEEPNENDPNNLMAGTEGEPEEIEYECAPTDYVHWKDFGHSQARTWEEVTSVWRWVYMTRNALIERFGEELGRKIPTDSSPDSAQKYGSGSTKTNDRAKICELWDKESGQVYWLHESFPDLLDQRDDPLELEGFFPCAKPLYATTTTDSLVPIPDFTLYQDQANELDILTDRIDGLVKALRVRGLYDASQPALQRLLTEGDNNTLIPVDKWMAFSEKGGLKGSIDLLPIDSLAATLIQCYQAQAQIKGQIYEITGISDIIRGQSAASETATAQQIKGQYAGLRLRAMQEGVAMFATELLRLKAQIICTKFQPETVLAYAAAGQMSDADKQLIPQALQLISNSPLRNFRIEVDADSLIQLDEAQSKQERVEFLNAFSNFLREAIPAGQATPELAPMLLEMIKFGVAGFKQARTIEGTIDVALQQLTEKSAQNAQNPQPSPEEMKIKAEQQSQQLKAQTDTQIQQARAQADIQIAQMKAEIDAQLENQRQQHEISFKMQENASKEQFDKWKAELDAATKIMVARIAANPGIDVAVIDAEEAAKNTIIETLSGQVQHHANLLSDMHNNVAAMHDHAMQTGADMTRRVEEAARAATAPKRIIRGPDGRAIGVEVVQ
jgi:hypothetical protein